MAINIKDFAVKVGNILSTLRFISSSTIRVENGATGYKFHVIAPAQEIALSSTYKYNGYFSLEDASEDDVLRVSISDGRCRINIYDFYVSGLILDITETGYIYLQATMSQDGVVSDPEIKFISASEETDTPPAYEQGVLNAVLGKVIVGDGTISNIQQIQYGFLYGIIWGQCND